MMVSLFYDLSFKISVFLSTPLLENVYKNCNEIVYHIMH